MAWVVAAVLALVIVGLVVVLVVQRAAFAAATARVGEVDQDREAWDTGRQELEGRVATLQADLDGARSHLTAVEADLAGARSQLATVEADLVGARSQLATVEADLVEARSQLAIAEARAATVDSDLRAAATSQMAAQTRVGALEAELRTAAAARTAAEEKAAAAQAELRIARSAGDEARSRTAALETALQAARSAAASAAADVPPVPAAADVPPVPAAADVPSVPAAADVPPVPAAAHLPTAGSSTGGADVRLAAVWALAELAQRRAWRLSLAPPGEARLDGLAGALSMEVERIREEIGTPGSLETHLEPAVAPSDASLALLAARELLAALVPHTQAFDMAVGRDGAQLAVKVVCTGWDGPPEAADDVSRLLAAVAPTGADLQLDADSDGRLQATLQIPLLG